jgi:hypothetical protein
MLTKAEYEQDHSVEHHLQTGVYRDPFDRTRVVLVKAVHRADYSIPGCIPAGHTPTLLEALGVPAHSTWQSYCNAISRFIDGKIDYKTVISIWSRRLANGKAS